MMSSAEYLNRSLADTKRVEAKLARALVQRQKNRREDGTSDPIAPTATGKEAIRLTFDEGNRNYANELEQLFLDYFEPSVARRLMERKELSDPEVQRWAVDAFYTDIKPKLETFRGDLRNVGSVLSLLQREYDKADVVNREAKAYQAADRGINNLWDPKRTSFSSEERALYTQIVLEAKAMVNEKRASETNLPEERKDDLVNSFVKLFEIDRTKDVLALYVRPNSAIRKTLGRGYATTPEVDSIKVLIRKELRNAHYNMTTKSSLSAPTLPPIYHDYKDSVITYGLFLKQGAVERHFDLARDIFKHEKGLLDRFMDQIIQQRVPVLPDGSAVPFVDGRRVVAPAPSAPVAAPKSAPSSAPVKGAFTMDSSDPFASVLGKRGPYTKLSGEAPIKQMKDNIPNFADIEEGGIEGPRVWNQYGSGAATGRSVDKRTARRGDVPLSGGKYYLNAEKLQTLGILEVRYSRNRHLVQGIKMQLVSPEFRDLVLAHLRGNQTLNRAAFMRLSTDEQHLFRALTRYLNMDAAGLPDVSEDMTARFQLVFGALRAGNNNPEIKKEAFVLLRHAYQTKSISSADYHSIMRTYGL